MKSIYLLLLLVSIMAGEVLGMSSVPKKKISGVLNDPIQLSGKSNKVFEVDPVLDSARFQAVFSMEKFPELASDNAFYELILDKTIETDRIRYVCNDDYARVLEIRVFEPGMPNYPQLYPVVSDQVEMENYAAGSRVTASSSYAGFEPEGAVDGIVGNENRWVAGDKQSYWLELDFGSTRSIGCLQVLSGLVSANQIDYPAKDFRLEYMHEGNWLEIPGTRSGAEPGSFGVVAGYSKQGCYALIHQQESPVWSVRHIADNGSEIILAALDEGPDIREREKYILTALNADGRLSFLLNGDVLLFADAAELDRPGFSVSSLSSGNRFELRSVEINSLDSQRYAFLENITIETLQGDALPVSFSPYHLKYNIQIPDPEIQAVRLQVDSQFKTQQVLINGIDTKTVELQLNGDRSQTVEVIVQSEDGTRLVYAVELLPVPLYSDFKTVFEDRFDGGVPNEQEWYYRVDRRWNSIQQKEQVSIENGKLKITLEKGANETYLAGGLITKKMFSYGYYETSAKLWKGIGWHSAFWQMGYTPPGGHPEGYAGPENNQINEIDCFESATPGGYSSNLHYWNPQRIVGAEEVQVNVAEQFNTYAWEWTPTKVRFFLNGKMTREVDYLPPHGLQNVWLTCVAHNNASTSDLPGEINFDYIRYCSKGYGNEVLPGATILTTADAGYFEKGDWKPGEYNMSHRYDMKTRVSHTNDSLAGWEFTAEETGMVEIYVWNAYAWPDGPVISMPYKVEVNDQITLATFNPMKQGQIWVSLGQYNLSQGDACRLSVAAGQDSPVALDAIMIVRSK